MTKTFYNPYHFVPLADKPKEALKKEDFENNLSYHSHASYTENTHSGRLLCKVTLKTPCVFGGVHEGEAPLTVKNFKLNRELAIPATSLRGMLSSIIEVASASALRVLDDEKYSVRVEIKDALKNIGRVIQKDNKLYISPFKFILKLAEPNTTIKKDFPKRLIQKIEQDTGNQFNYNKKYYLKYSSNNWDSFLEDFDSNSHITKKIWIDDINKLTFLLAEDNESISGYIRMIETPERELPESKFNKIPYNKTVYFLSNADEKNTLEIDENVRKNYQYIADNITEKEVKKLEKKLEKKSKNIPSELVTPYHPLGRNRDEQYKLTLKENDIIFYKTDDKNKNKATEISFSAIWRKAVPNDEKNKNIAGTHDFFKFLDKEFLPMNPNRDKITPAELLFGFTNDETIIKADDKKVFAYKGKVRVSFGRLSNKDRSKKSEELEKPAVTLKILASPKPPCPNMYFTARNNNDPIKKSFLKASDHKPQGVKFYLNHKLENQQAPWVTNPVLDKDGKDPNIKQKSKVTPIKEETEFYFHIDFNNLDNTELGMLCYALKPTEGFLHKLGLGKSIGLGSIQITPLALLEVNRQERYKINPLGITEKPKRYHKIQIFKDVDCKDLPDIDTNDCDHKETIDFNTLKQKFKEPDNIHNALKALGESYPTEKIRGLEEKGYEWFVNNDKEKKQNLKPISENATIQLLTENVEPKKSKDPGF